MARYDAPVAVGVIGLAGFQLLEAWNKNAPTLADIRKAHPNDVTIRQHLMDADFMVGGLAILLGITFATITHDATALIIMLVMFGSISFWFHSVLNAESR